MAIYITVFFTSVFFAWVYETRFSPRRVQPVFDAPDLRRTEYRPFSGRDTLILSCLVLSVLPIWWITAMRYSVGTDYAIPYVFNFLAANNEGVFCFSEPGMNGLNLLLGWLGCNYQAVFITTGTVITVLFPILIYRQSDTPAYSLMIFFASGMFFHSLNNVRQYVAMAIALVAILDRKHPIRSVLLIVIGGLFHYAAFLYLPLYLAIQIKLPKKVYRILTVAALAVSPLLTILAKAVIARTKYAYFLNIETPSVSWLTVLINLFFFALYFYYYDPEDPVLRGAAVFQFVAAVFTVLSVMIPNEELWVRTIRLVSCIPMLFCTVAFRREKRAWLRWGLTIGTAVMLGLYTLYTVVLHGGQGVLPYQYIFGVDTSVML